jgi:hypothetical protein
MAINDEFVAVLSGIVPNRAGCVGHVVLSKSWKMDIDQIRLK